MNKDEEKAIEVLKRVLMANRFDGIFTSIDIIIEAIDIVLNLIKKQQEEIGFYKSIIKTEKKKYKNTKKSLKGQLQKKDKIINEMVKHILNSAIVDDTVCGVKFCEEENDCSEEKMKKCTIDYFTKKVEE